MNLSHIARRTGLSNSTISRLIDKLIQIGLLKELKVGNMRVVALNSENPISKALINLVKEVEKVPSQTEQITAR